jgi:hypothetical protein
LYSKHYGAIVDHEDKPVPIHRALEEIKCWWIKSSPPITSAAELGDIDVPSYIYFYHALFSKGDQGARFQARGIIKPRAAGSKAEKSAGGFMRSSSQPKDSKAWAQVSAQWPSREQLSFFGDDDQPVLPKDFLLWIACICCLAWQKPVRTSCPGWKNSEACGRNCAPREYQISATRHLRSQENGSWLVR